MNRFMFWMFEPLVTLITILILITLWMIFRDRAEVKEKKHNSVSEYTNSDEFLMKDEEAQK